MNTLIQTAHKQLSLAPAIALAAMSLLGTANLTAEMENASNPLAAVNNTDVRFQYYDLGDGADLYDSYLDGSYMLAPTLKLKYELHYQSTNVTGQTEDGFETFHFKPIWFPTQGKIGDWKYRVALGAEWIVGFDNEDRGIGTGSDQIAPLAGIAFMKGGTVFVPLVQQFVSYSGTDTNQTAFRLIAIQTLPNDCWGKVDAKLPVDWENDEEIPATLELQLGHMFTPRFGTYIDGLFGVGGDQPYDWGVGLGLRFNY